MHGDPRPRSLFQVGGYWFFGTREKINVGPFRTRREAAEAGELLTQRLAARSGNARRIVVELTRACCVESINPLRGVGRIEKRPSARIKIGFVLLSNSQRALPSTRVSVLNMWPFLKAAGFDPHIVFEPEQATERPDLSRLDGNKLASEGYQIVYFQKAGGPGVEAAARRLSSAGIRTVYGVCDRVDVGMAEVTDMTIAVTSFLKNLYPERLQTKVHVVPDGIENPAIHKLDWGDHRGSAAKPLRAVLVTSDSLSTLPVIETPPKWLEVTIVGAYPDGLNHVRRTLEAARHAERARRLRFVFSRRIRCVPWDQVSVYQQLQHADIGIIPVDPEEGRPGATPVWKTKSENRLTLKMSVGLPVIASPVPSYESVIDHGINGFLADSRSEWMKCLEALRDPGLRRDMGQRARECVSERFSKDTQAARLVRVLRRLVTSE
jgi:glycosyltransferase involved in cell wall biosynthesis